MRAFVWAEATVKVGATAHRRSCPKYQKKVEQRDELLGEIKTRFRDQTSKLGKSDDLSERLLRCETTTRGANCHMR